MVLLLLSGDASAKALRAGVLNSVHQKLAPQGAVAMLEESEDSNVESQYHEHSLEESEPETDDDKNDKDKDAGPIEKAAEDTVLQAPGGDTVTQATKGPSGSLDEKLGSFKSADSIMQPSQPVEW